MKISRLLGATALAGSLFVGSGALAQGAGQGSTTVSAPQNQGSQTGQDTSDSSDTILVTGSRIAGATALDSPVPITQLTAAELVDDGNLSLGDALNRLPSLRATWGQQNSSRSIGTAGLNLLDLRGIGIDRTLVLVNGRRHVSSVPGQYVVDVNTIPNALLESIDIITGGTSAVYGSDAIAGVVNFKLKRDFEGLEARFQGGVSSRGDRGAYLGSVVAGRNFAEGRGNIAISAEFARSNTVLQSARNDLTGALTGIPGLYATDPTSQLVNGVLVNEPPEGDGIPDQSLFNAYPGSTFGNISLGGWIGTACPNLVGIPNAALLARRAAVCTGAFSQSTPNLEFSNGYAFGDDGVLRRDNPERDLRYLGGGLFGGRSATGQEGAMLLPGLERYATNLLFNYEFSPAARFYLEGKYAHITNNQTSTQPTFLSGSPLTATFSVNNPFLSAANRATLATILAPGATAFSMLKFNNDLGTRAEDHKRQTYRIVAGFDGQLSETGNLSYDIAFNYGRTKTFYETGGNVDIAKFNAALNATTNASGQIVCAVNADAITTNDMPGCVAYNPFGINQASQAAKDYVLYTSSRREWAEQINVVASLAGDTSSLFELPGGPVSFAVGGEYRREDAYQAYDAFTAQQPVAATALNSSGRNTFLNAFAPFDPAAVTVKEGFGEIKVPLLRDSFLKEVTLTGAARYSKYSNIDKAVFAWNAGLVVAPVDDFRVRVGLAKAVRAPNLSDLYGAPAQSFFTLADPCNQGAAITSNPNRVRNCAAAGVPTTLTYTDDQGIVRTVPWTNTASTTPQFTTQGNPLLQPETSKSLTVGAVFQPRFLPGFSVTLDYYRIKVSNVIASLAAQTVINQCYDDPVSINNPFCAVVFRRTSADQVANATFAGQTGRNLAGIGAPVILPLLGPSVISQGFNYAKYKTSGIDADIRYNHTFGNGLKYSYRAVISWLENRETFTFITAPEQSTRQFGTLGDPIWRGTMQVNLAYKGFDVGYDMTYLGKQAIFGWETQYTHQGRGPTNLDVYKDRAHPATDYHDVQIGYRVNKNYRAYFGVDNLMDTQPPNGQNGTGAGGGIWNVVGRYFYAGVNLNF
ncbi:TonB-dependent receptor domain-containing protein [Sphingomonas sp.]|uniref:TonB-dependent receptor domain-containing protein n=1 Tax=Sphingomonas sp. TaxID=28214 RepID=UPI002DD6972E|nr:TonB-dependent receptor [Sphingomonas sp.]